MKDVPDDDEVVVGRRLDAALREALGSERAPDVTAAVLARHAACETGELVPIGAGSRTRWLAFAAALMLGVLTVIGVALLQRAPGESRNGSEDVRHDEVQHAEILEVTTRAQIATLPTDLRAVELRNVQDDAIADLVARCPDLEHLRIHASTMAKRTDDRPAESITDVAFPVIARLQRLRQLALVGVVLVKGTRLRELERLPLLESLSLGYFDVDDEALDTLPRLPSLRQLEIKMSHVLGQKGLAAIGNCPGLRRLSIYGAPGQEPEHFAPLAQLQQLESLDLSGIAHWFRGHADAETARRFGLSGAPPNLGSRGLTMEALQAWPRLRELAMSSSRDLVAEVGNELRRRYPLLERLDLRACPNIDDTTIAQVLAIKSLRSLTLGDCPHVSELSLPGLVAANQLRSIDFGFTPWLTLAHAEQLLRAGKLVACTRPADPAFERQLRSLVALHAHTTGQRQNEIVRTVAEIAALPPNAVNIECRGLGDQAVPALAKRTNLVALEFVNDATGDRLTRAGLASICKLPRLESLVLMNLTELRDADLVPLADLRALKSLSFTGIDVGDATLAALPALKQLTELSLHGIRSFGEAGMRSLAKCSGLQHLDLGKCSQLAAPALAHVGALRQLLVLDLSDNPGLSNSAVMSLRECKALRRLNLAGGRFTSTALQALSGMRELEALDLGDNDALETTALLHVPVSVRELGISNTRGMSEELGRRLAERFPDLRELRLGRNDHVTDQVLEAIVAIPSLQRLDLSECMKLTSASFPTVRGAPSLRYVNLVRTAVMRKEQQEQLKVERPELEVVQVRW